MKNATLLYRIASVLYFLFAAGHTYGSLNFKAPTAEGRAVAESMRQVHFQVGSASFSYENFYKGMALSVTVYLLAYAVMSWQLGTVAGQTPQAIRGLGWVLFGSQLVLIV